MEGKKNNGGSAFPVPSYVNADGKTFDSSCKGMALLDWFAGQALAGIIANTVYLRNIESSAELIGKDIYEYVVLEAYLYADAMLAERIKK